MVVQRDDVVDVTATHMYATWRPQKDWKPLHIVDAEGCYFTDAEGRRILDFTSQLACSNLGHKNQALIEAICDQARKMPFISPGFSCDVRVQASQALAEVMPSGLEKFFFSTSGTEANEAAVKIARLCTGRYKIISRYHSYHGSTAASIALTGDPRRLPSEPTGKIPGVVFAPDAYCYRCPFNLEYPNCGIACADYVDYMVRHEGNVAAIIVEPVVGANGVIVPPKEYLPKLESIAHKNDVLFIADEVMTAWGRVGEWFAVNHWNVKPDIITTAKGLTGAYTPLGLTVTTSKVADYFENHYFAHGHTYSAHPLTLAPVAAAIKEYKRLDLINRSRSMGEYLGKRLRELKKSHRSIGDVRGLGLFWALELVKNGKTKKPFNERTDVLTGQRIMVNRVAAEMMKQGVYIFSWINCLNAAPPLIITQEELDKGIEALDKALAISDQEAEIQT